MGNSVKTAKRGEMQETTAHPDQTNSPKLGQICSQLKHTQVGEIWTA